MCIRDRKEGWDCPFAYILASLANKTSQVDVEQILGRILRLPYTAEHKAKALNMSYVLTSSNDFNDTVQQIIRNDGRRWEKVMDKAGTMVAGGVMLLILCVLPAGPSWERPERSRQCSALRR